MKYLFFCFLTVLLNLLPLTNNGQEYNYVQYGTEDGLPGATVYDLLQDQDGFLWIATNNGLSRYDGTSFKSFSVQDGLPDNEVLKIFKDSKGRLWIGTFSKEPCFYYQGKIHNSQNTPWLKKIYLTGSMLAVYEDEKGTLMISDFQNINEVTKENQVRVITEQPIFKKYQGKQKFASPDYYNGGFTIHVDDTFFIYRPDTLIYFSSFKGVKQPSVILRHYADGTYKVATLKSEKLTQTPFKNVVGIVEFVSTTDGAWSVDTVENKLDEHFLSGRQIAKTIRDNEGNIWFGSLGDGLFRIVSTDIRSIFSASPYGSESEEVFSLALSKNTIVCGLSDNRIAYLNARQISNIENIGTYEKHTLNRESTHKIRVISPMPEGDLLIGSDAFLVNATTRKKANEKLIAIKSISPVDKEQAVIGTYNYAYKIDVEKMVIIDTLFKGRCTKVFYDRGHTYIGTPAGLYDVTEKGEVKYLGENCYPLTRRITDIIDDGNGVIWAATNDVGVVALRSGKMIRHIQEKDGLTSNICSSLFFDGSFLFVGTNKGLNRLDLTSTSPFVMTYGLSDGLPSNIINDVLVKDSTVYVATPKGLTYFPENIPANQVPCNLKLLTVRVSDKELPLSSNYQLNYKDNNIAFEYVAISFRSAGDIEYFYKLDGLDTAWRSTNETRLEYQTLPSGNYSLSLYAINKFGIKSKPYKIDFSISTPFWKSGWAYTIAFLGMAGLVMLVFNRRSKALQRRYLERSRFEKQFNDLEQQALQAQMNPHFIFNCLNSIQQYILTNEKEKANLYLTGFASLIRQTLNISGKKSIKVAEEIQFLKDYLDMEQMRFGDSFSYELNADPDIDLDFVEMPALLIQPYVENALRHGIRHRQEPGGKVKVDFEFDKTSMTCRIWDNGVGRLKAASYQSVSAIHHQSKGMTLTEKRVELINMMSNEKINIEIHDLYDGSGAAAGTEVVIKIPI